MIDSMDISQESQALPPESSHQPPPIPPIPPIPSIPNPPPLISSPPPLNLEIPTKTVDGRQILKPVAPSKRPLPENPQRKSRENSYIANAFLPQELTDIIATRQRRERAWHARLLICTTMISSIDSTLINFTEELEIEEVMAFKAYLQQAIANFAAADSSPSPPHIPSHTRPSNGNINSTNKDKNSEKVVVSTPRIALPLSPNSKPTHEVVLPSIPKTSDNSWATVACNGQKKARVFASNKMQDAPKAKISQRQLPKDKSETSGSDQRLFVRLPQDHEWRKLSPAGIREVIFRKLSISPTLFNKIKPVHSGFALSPCGTEAREAILKAGNGLFLSEAKLEPATNWVPVIIPTVPASIRKEQGDTEVNSSMLADEVERVCSV
ncbi:putative eka-like protein [Erysiphe necator]|uniref:Putative eka-like protein n=1 Tax=Uncinula necator TaxID=52586 RepID=A0A0B1NZ40_UNCNE|nr:putative eka-like protein [Erysiphe necator]